MAGAPVERVPFAVQEREYRLHAREGKAIVGRTAFAPGQRDALSPALRLPSQ
jgi:hypothetical protein